VPVLLEQSIDTRNAAVPAVFEILEGQASVLRVGLLSLHRILGPNTCRIEELRFPWLKVPVQVGNKLVLLVRHTGAEVSHCIAGIVSENSQDIMQRLAYL
jgi:hypothetical protein